MSSKQNPKNNNRMLMHDVFT